ncbi:putative bifunctional diguanylate cyclase/phosphodiesterase [Devosia faecipullorum]|uniref:putative bifunctional diguanylate cyclase/phosphodiesterase n=1 Tax=Devosia faecipullorum TaxID=2755039 RepID=UPI00187B668B|nr:EAL domain-containing protein [Devosia faecipullorum]MBE7732691.1 EAL domain-containing protein [Devosia faecipullorum]
MPALDYVSIIRSVYGDRRQMLLGAFASAAVAAVSAFKAEAPILWCIAAALLIVGFVRLYNMNAFWRTSIGDDDAESAERWENRALVGGALVALTHGVWCLVAILVVRDPFAELASCTLTIAATVGLVARNFGLDRLLTIQIVSLSVPLWLAMVFRGDFYNQLLAAMMVLLLFSYRKHAAAIRSLLLSAVHGRVEISRLAAEFDIAITTLEHGLCMLDENGTITLANDRAVEIFASQGIDAPTGRPFTPVLAAMTSGSLPKSAASRLQAIIDKRGSGKVQVGLGPDRIFEVTVSSGQQRTVLLFEDISERLRAEERINFIARHDVLTGLPNRGHFHTLALKQLQARADAGEPSVLMIVDIDEFKYVNDSYGHVVGDEVLRQVADRLREVLPKGTLLARFGGDEFIALCAGNEQSEDRAERILAAFAPPFMLNSVALPVRVSIGIAPAPADQNDLEELMTKANLALDSAKSEGKGRSRMFHAQMDTDYHSRQKLKTELRHAVAEGHLSLVFQPLIDVSTRRVVSCEALVRWSHAEFGPIPPAVFIPLAEEMGLISEITAWVVDNAAQQCRSWASPVGVAVNISARDFRGTDLPALIERALENSGLAPERFEIEVTETALIEERDLAGSVLRTLADRGIAIALDDFGTGYSSLSYLSALPFTKLKIDRSFVSDIASNARALRLLANVARLGRDLDLLVVAEGVESEDQLNAMIAETSVQQVQGYLFSRPLPARDIAELIERFNGQGWVSRPQGKRFHG